MKVFCVYILYSKSIDRFYIGYTENMESRLDQHNRHVFKGSFTDRADDWELYHSIPNLYENTAKLIEKHIKKNKISLLSLQQNTYQFHLYSLPVFYPCSCICTFHLSTQM
ncbi:GIY-YIG nuclease family protein [Aquiflexum balticum]|uniref:GIY-YIG nuclease family protein n=1 Tax=Aquiflexum balticum TaxID=280473 RepID=UPI0015603B52